MRLPGFKHRKGKPSLVSIEHINTAAAYPAEHFRSPPATPTVSAQQSAAEQHQHHRVAEPRRLGAAAVSKRQEAIVGRLPGFVEGPWSRPRRRFVDLTDGEIVDFGVADQGDERQGKRTPVELVMEHTGKDSKEVADWLAEKLGCSEAQGPYSYCNKSRPASRPSKSERASVA